jgi:hypothetical protein
MIVQQRNKKKEFYSQFRSNTLKKFPTIEKKPVKFVPKKKVVSMRDFSVVSNVQFNRQKTFEEPPLQFSNFYKKKEESVIEEDFVIEPEIVYKTEEDLKESIPFDNNFSSEPVMQPISQYRYKQKIFDESKDIYYKKIKTEGLINYKNIGGKGVTQDKRDFELQSEYGEQVMPKRFIRASVE